MKTALFTILAATLQGFATTAGGRPFDAAELVAISFATGLVAWTVAQYNHGTPRDEAGPDKIARPIHLPAIPRVRHAEKQVGRLAA